jgi:hypothetical protein
VVRPFAAASACLVQSLVGASELRIEFDEDFRHKTPAARGLNTENATPVLF